MKDSLMNYTSCYTNLKSVFTTEKKSIDIPWSGIKIFNSVYRSGFPQVDFLNNEDHLILENEAFTYPVFKPSCESNKVILLLHGLNERSWLKYLVWAYWLAENTSSYVILFPIAFHINRSPESWKDPRVMVPFMNDRSMAIGKTNMLSFANAALSKRLSDDPMRFFNSGYQTATDLTDLLLKIRDGKHEVIPGGCRINIFAYSIGAFLAEIMMMANPENLFNESKLYMFCGGSVFSNMNGRSKLIMDSYAFERVYDFYLHEFEDRIKGENRIFRFLRTSQIGLAFRSMIDRSRFGTFRENMFRKLKDQIRCTILSKDTVIPSAGVIETLNETRKKDVVSILDFNYPYSHENPFPFFNNPLSREVDRSFDLVFEESGAFLR